MPQSLSNIFVHIVFSTKDRKPFLLDEQIRSRAHAYIGGIVNNCGCMIVVVGGVEDHVHLLLKLSRTETVAKVVATIKSNSSLWLKDVGGISHFSWQAGYGAFSVGHREMDGVKNYISGQAEHHKKVTFQEEYRRLLQEAGIEFDERYLWD